MAQSTGAWRHLCDGARTTRVTPPLCASGSIAGCKRGRACQVVRKVRGPPRLATFNTTAATITAAATITTSSANTTRCMDGMGAWHSEVSSPTSVAQSASAPVVSPSSELPLQGVVCASTRTCVTHTCELLEAQLRSCQPSGVYVCGIRPRPALGLAWSSVCRCALACLRGDGGRRGAQS